MKFLYYIILGSLLMGCGKKDNPVEVVNPYSAYSPMSNDDIIMETKKCTDAGLLAESLMLKPVHGERIVYVQCKPKTSCGT